MVLYLEGSGETLWNCEQEEGCLSFILQNCTLESGRKWMKRELGIQRRGEKAQTMVRAVDYSKRNRKGRENATDL